MPVELVAIDPAIVVGVVETGGRILVEDHRGAGVKLKSGAGADRSQRSFDHVFDGADFGWAESKEEATAGIENGADAHREGVFRHLFQATEDGAVIAESLLGENLDPGAGTEGAGRLVEANVPVAAETQELDIDTTGIDNTMFVAAALGVEIGGGAVRDVRALLVDVDVAEKIFPHEIPIGLIVRAGKTDIFVEVKSGDAAEIQTLFAVQSDEFLIKPQRRPAGGETEDGIRFFADDAGDDFCAEDAANLGGFADEDFHGSGKCGVTWERLRRGKA